LPALAQAQVTQTKRRVHQLDEMQELAQARMKGMH
jgi:hypothetical protein